MYTRCPTCSTCFRVTDRHLSLAKGKVRCGQCQLVFNAPEHAIDDLPVKTSPAETTKAAKPKIKKPLKPAAVKKQKKPTVKKPATKVTKPDANATPITNTLNLNNDDLFDDNFDLDAAINELTQATEDAKDILGVKEKPSITKPEQFIPTEDNSGDIFDTDAYAATNASSVTDIMEEMENQLPADIAESNTPDKEYNADDEFEFIELDGIPETKDDFAKQKNDEAQDQHFEVKVKEIDADEPEQKTVVLEVPLQLRNDIERLQASPLKNWHPLYSISFIVFLLFTSFTQLAYFRAYELVELVPASRPVLEAFCGTVGCQYSGPRNIKHTQLLSRDVRLHPKEKKVLLISLIMINNAHFAQPYPDIHIRLSDISGTVVAERVFSAKTYMGKLSNPFLLMKSKTPVHINFEVVDPGIYPVNFEFTFL
jgi:predicted Zn finger-like uncharacterized protein